MAAPPHVIGEGAALGEGAANPAQQSQRHLDLPYLATPGDAKPGGAYVAVHGRITRSLLQLPYANVPGWHGPGNLNYIFPGPEFGVGM